MQSSAERKTRDLLWLFAAIPFLLLILFTVQGSVEVRSSPEQGAEILVDGKPAHPIAPGVYRSGLLLIGPHQVGIRESGMPERQSTAFVWLSQRVVVQASASISGLEATVGSMANDTPPTTEQQAAPASMDTLPTGYPSEAPLPTDAEQAPVVAAAPETSDLFSGEWAGEVDQDGQRYPVTMVLRPASGDGECGTIVYPSLGCRGILTNRESEGVILRVNESLTAGGCVNGGLIRLVLAGSSNLEWSWFYSSGQRGAEAHLSLVKR